MAGRKALVLTAKEVNELGKHILNLPFKRRIEERCLHMLKDKKNLQDLSEQDRQLIQKCRYERNAYNKRMLQLKLIQQIEAAKRNTLEQNILKLYQKNDIDAYFAMHDALDEILKTQRHQTTAKNLNQKIEKALNPEQQKEKASQKKQKKREDQIKYFIGSLYIESLQKASISFSKDNSDLDKLADMIHAYLSFRKLKRNLGTIEQIEAIVQRMPTTKNMNRLLETAKTDPRNPFNKTPDQ